LFDLPEAIELYKPALRPDAIAKASRAGRVKATRRVPAKQVALRRPSTAPPLSTSAEHHRYLGETDV
jgi:hypothetical protein